jgi:signal transduction histidine kinase
MRRSQELARQQMEFVATVSHELRTPLAVVRAAGDNLAEGVIQDEAQVRKYSELVRSEGRRLTEMVEQILELAGIDSGQRPVSIAPVHLDALVEGVLRSSATLIESAHLDLQVEIPADLPPVTGEEGALRRVFQNLVGNAIKYGGEGRWIGVEGRRSGAGVSVTVSDRGIGIAPADQERIFARSRNTRSTSSRSTASATSSQGNPRSVPRDPRSCARTTARSSSHSAEQVALCR